ncbi:MAG: response regulator [Leptolyngbya sp. SIO4C1]|nr:response regulator [Leptolyngbya sp. SIO4C1]
MKHTILVIEDEAQVRENIQEILEINGYIARGADDGQAGLAATQAYMPDLILCDVMMPNLDGYGVIAALQQQPETAAIPFIFLTAKADRSHLRQGMNLGADDYLTKPFETAELLTAIQTRLAKKSAIDQYQLQQSDELSQSLVKTQQKAVETRQLADIKDELLSKISADLREPLSNINVAIHMLSQTHSLEEQERYIRILKEEYAREMNLLNQLDNLRSLLTPENAKLLQSFNLLNK